jgi:lipid II:glycine glycyltransferase (peptidoglycan interpeptide bridge formation enzyme)
LNSFLGDIETEIRKYSPDYMLVYTVPNFPDMRFFKWNDYDVMPKYTYVVDLTRPLEEIWDNFHKDVKRCVKLANGYGLELRMSNDVSTLHERQERRYREKAANFSMEGEYLKEVFKAYPDNTKVYYVYNNRGEVVSGMNSQEYNGKFMLWMGIARAKEHANEFLIWKVIEKARSEGFKKFEIAGADEKDLNQFKSRFSPSLETWYRISKTSLFGKAAESLVDIYNIVKRRMFVDVTFVIVSLANAFHGIFELFFENTLY